MGDKSRSTLLRSCVEVSTSDNLTTFLKEVGFRSVVSLSLIVSLCFVTCVKCSLVECFMHALDHILDQAVSVQTVAKVIVLLVRYL